MLKSGKVKYSLMLIAAFWLIMGHAHAQKLWSQVRLNRSSTYVNQPVEVTITVYTSTWFTSGLDPGNIKVNGAFTTYFRPVSTSFMEGGQNYAGIQLIYHVFPFEEKDVVFPSLTLEVETPPDGDFRGVRRKLHTKERIIKVRPIPPGFSKSDWLVANGLSVSDHWSNSGRKVKVGDVLVRRITRRAYGTVSELIPPVHWDSVIDVSLYPSRSEVNNYKGKTAISATRTETMRYLFEKEGEVTLPEMVFTWYHPYQKKLYKRTLKSVTFEVAPNPDLGMLSSVRDSLLVQKKQEELVAKADKPILYFGMTPKEILILIATTFVLLSLVVFVLQKFVKNYKKRRQAYFQSELYFFNQLKKSLKRADSSEILKRVYRWLDEMPGYNNGLMTWVESFGSQQLIEEVQAIENEEANVRHQIHEWRSARKKYLHFSKSKVKNENLKWINP